MGLLRVEVSAYVRAPRAKLKVQPRWARRSKSAHSEAAPAEQNQPSCRKLPGAGCRPCAAAGCVRAHGHEELPPGRAASDGDVPKANRLRPGGHMTRPPAPRAAETRTLARVTRGEDSHGRAHAVFSSFAYGSSQASHLHMGAANEHA